MNKALGFFSMEYYMREREVAVINTLLIRPCSLFSLMQLSHTALCASGQWDEGGRI